MGINSVAADKCYLCGKFCEGGVYKKNRDEKDFDFVTICHTCNPLYQSDKTGDELKEGMTCQDEMKK